MDEALGTLAAILSGQAGDDFESATIAIEVDEGWSRMSFRCVRAGREVVLDVDAMQLSEADDAIDDIIAAQRAAGHGGWRRALFTLSPDGESRFVVFGED